MSGLYIYIYVCIINITIYVYTQRGMMCKGYIVEREERRGLYIRLHSTAGRDRGMMRSRRRRDSFEPPDLISLFRLGQ